MESRRIYCVVPGELAGRLHETLRRHFRDRPEVEVVVDARRRERRSGEGRRLGEGSVELGAEAERRRIRSASGRRVAERRARAVALPAADRPALPRRASPSPPPP